MSVEVVRVTGTHACAVVASRDAFDELADRFLERGALDGLLPLRIAGDDVGTVYAAIHDGRSEAVARRFAEMGAEAVADGYRGLCAVADVTALLETPELLGEYRRYELVIDRWMRRAGVVRGLCVVDGSRAGEDACIDVCVLHEHSTPEVAFRFVTDPEDDSIHVVGSVDAVDAPAFRRCLAAAGELGPIVIRLDRCDYLDHTALVAIDQLAVRSGTSAQLVGASGVVARLSDLLELTHVEMATAGTDTP